MCHVVFSFFFKLDIALASWELARPVLSLNMPTEQY